MLAICVIDLLKIVSYQCLDLQLLLLLYYFGYLATFSDYLL